MGFSPCGHALNWNHPPAPHVLFPHGLSCPPHHLRISPDRLVRGLDRVGISEQENPAARKHFLSPVLHLHPRRRGLALVLWPTPWRLVTSPQLARHRGHRLGRRRHRRPRLRPHPLGAL